MGCRPALKDWALWMTEEDAHYARDPTRERADFIIDGTRSVERE
jgi:hypothetical protein